MFLFRIFLCLVLFLFGTPALQAETCLARKRIADIGFQYTRLHTGSQVAKREAAEELTRLMPLNNYHGFALQLSAEGYGIDTSRLVEAFIQIDQQVEKLNAGQSIEPLGASVRGVLPSLSEATKCPSPLNDVPTKVSSIKSIGIEGENKETTPVERSTHAQASTGRLLSFTLPSALSHLASIIALGTVLVIFTAFLFKRRLLAFFARKSRLARRSLSLDFEIHFDEGHTLIVSCVDISTGGMKIGLNSPTAEPLTVGSQIELRLPGRDVCGSIVWSNNFYCGVAFRKRLSNRAFREVTGET